LDARDRKLLLEVMRGVRYLFAVLIHDREIDRNTTKTELELTCAVEKLSEARHRAKPIQELINHLEGFVI